MGKENLRLRNNGITLVALVITIVVILILSGVTIGLVTSQNGVIKTANSAKEKQEIEKEKGIVDQFQHVTHVLRVLNTLRDPTVSE